MQINARNRLFDKLDALEIHNLRVLLLTPVKRHAHFPWPGKDLRIVDRRFVLDDIGARPGVSLDDVKRIAVEVSGSIEPGLIVEALHIDDQRLALPMAYGLSHPRVHRRRTWVLEINVAHSARVFVGEEERFRALQDLKWVGHVRGARNAR